MIFDARPWLIALAVVALVIAGVIIWGILTDRWP
jgi:hypothetical protein